MAIVGNKVRLAETYAKAVALIAAGKIPTVFIQPGQVLYRSINPAKVHSYLPKPAPGGHVSRSKANLLLLPGDETGKEFKNRFTGHSGIASIPSASGLYFVQQQQALVNEETHYNRKVAKWALAGRCVIYLRVLRPILVADISPHNPGAKRFFRELGKDTWEHVNDLHDCSTARAIGLAIAHSGHLQGLSVQTVRASDRSHEERGDNLVLFAKPGQSIPGLEIFRADYYGKVAEPEKFEVRLP
jgi:hypothetical protein